MPDRPHVGVVTGANQGIGRAIVKSLRQRLDSADTVYLTGRNAAHVEAAAAELAAEGLPVVPHRLDVRSDDDVASFADVIADRHGGVGWPESVNVPSKIGQVAATRIFARLRAADAARDGILIAAICPGLVDTPTSRPWFADMSTAQTPDQAAAAIMPLALEPVCPEHYGQLVQFGRVIPWS